MLLNAPANGSGDRAAGDQIARLALGVAGASLLLNLLLLWAWRSPERILRPLLLRTVNRLEAEDAHLRFQVRVPAGTPLAADIPIDERLRLKIDATLPIDTRIRLPIRSPLGNYEVGVPVRADLPIRTEIPLHIRHTLTLRTATREEILLPVDLRVRELPLDALRMSLDPVP